MNSLPENLILSPLKQQDYPAVAALHLLGWQQAYSPIFGAEALQQFSLPAFEALWQERLAVPDRHYLGLWQHKQLLGFAGFGPAEAQQASAAEGEIYHFYLHPASWGRGVAGPLMKRVLGELKEGGYQRAVLWVLDANARARSFYANHQFSANGRRQERYRWGLHLMEVQLERSL
ncbi:GNAT family N-acetyltransferase [Cesiribacter andamanensis]|uniref:Putative acetyltransferase n=1 Tax=Cesiribacter andamanensis AMV16 TaxID=1279009 RepID=M7NB31_9BACT|nr:GNAT family N-acetyltransferase [Cesiribacter andamanensis]EMR04401.1 putative acetyltransferase [Cesiribacter andamanensis AMV16]